MKYLTKLLTLLALLTLPLWLSAQLGNFGRNKPNYEKFDFKVYQSPNFELYTYLDNEEWRQNFLNASEEWYRVHQSIFGDTIDFRNPLVIYADHADFQQTNTINGAISTGVGGVTEAFKNRVVMPVAHTNQQTHHVLGHELVHAFQFDVVIRGDSTRLRDLANVPLWMVEGLAEYLSIGAVDPFTAMWMRDAVLNDDVPSLKDLNSGRYFPYRYGQAFWAFVTGLKGDGVIAPYFRTSARLGVENATALVLGYSMEELSTLWQESLRKTYGPYVGEAKKDRNVGRELISREENGGRINVAPEISPNGKYLIFLSERDLFSVDLFLADARNGKIIRKIRTSTAPGHVDDLSYLENSGTWSPDSKQFAYTVVARGQNALVIADVDRGKAVRKIFPEGIPAFVNPAWSPDGKSILVSGLVEGQSDLYLIDLRTERVTRLTDDVYSEIQPRWSADGQRIFFSTDRRSIEDRDRPFGAFRFNLAEYDLVSGRSRDLPVFPGADNLNPVEGADGKLYFLSNRDGFRNIYRYDLNTERVEQLTDLITGVSGITHYAPAMSMDRQNSRLVYTYFNQRGYRIYGALTDRFDAREVPADAVDFSPATLPRLNPRAPLVVDKLLAGMEQEAVLSEEGIREVPYRPKFKLDYAAGSAGGGVGNNPLFGTTTGLAGGVQLLASDILGNNQLFGTLALNGEITDLGGSVAWLNRKSRLNYGFSLSRIPFRSFTSLVPRLDTLQISDDQFVEVGNAPYLIQRLYQNQVGVFAQFPFSTTLRLEGSLSGSYFTNRVDEYARYFDPTSGFPLNSPAVPERRRDLESESFLLGRAGISLVGDNANIGLTAPIRGQRFRVGAERFAGQFTFTALDVDYRKYLHFGKGTLALRALHYGRYGGNGDDLFPLYLGSPWYIRGLQANDIVPILEANGRNINELVGSKLLVGNLEIRVPFTGPKPLALIKSKVLFSDLNFFVDGGVAFTELSQFAGPVFTLDRNGNPLINEVTGAPFVARPGVTPIVTAGVSTRVNVFGQVIVEPYLARPLLRGGNWQFGLNFLPGW
jgi:hypothetical protein